MTWLPDLQMSGANFFCRNNLSGRGYIKNGFLQDFVGCAHLCNPQDDMVCVTKEHNYLMLLNKQLEEGTIDEEEYAREVKRGAALISYLGMGNVNLMDANPNPLPLEDGDIVVLCSDGLYKALSDAQIYEIISKNADDLEVLLFRNYKCRHKYLPEEYRIIHPLW